MIKQAEKEYSPYELEKRIRDFWKRSKAYRKTKQSRKEGEDYFFLDGPPYTTESAHLGTAWNKIIKDLIVRFRRMHGYNVRDQPGYDMHGLPIEVQVERSLGIMNKKQIEELGIKKFVDTCRDFALQFQEKMTQQFEELGVWMDWDKPYRTIENSYMEGAWWTIKKAHEKGLLDQAQRVLQWCPRCETALAEAEIEYFDETDPSLFVMFPLVDREDEYILVWTTTPWTLPANLAAAVHPNLDYAKVLVTREGSRQYVWLYEGNVEQVMGTPDVLNYDVKETVSGKELVGLEYKHPLANNVPYLDEIRGNWVHKVLASDIVTDEFTGIVHMAPGHGPEDFDIGIQHDLPAFCPVDERGYFTTDAGDYRTMHVREANRKIIDDLTASGALFNEEDITHRYGHCWRCQTPIIYRVTEQWFLKVKGLKDKMLKEVDKIQWTPEWAGASRQYDWVQNARDWCISRQRYWGIPLPIWKCECGEMTVVGSSKELSEGENYVEGMDLHRPSIDSVVLTCPACKKEVHRITDILDVWFDSGVCSWAQLGYPGRRDEFKRWWPARWITEAPDQTRGWFYSQLGAGVIAFDRAPYESVLVHGWLNDSEGLPMSKSRGNTIEPSGIVHEFGADALRFYLLRTSAPWEDISFQTDEVKNAKRTLNILWNVQRFASTYMAIDDFDPEEWSLDSLSDHMRPEDRWILSRLQKVKILAEEELESYNIHKACREVEDFILNDLSRWYVRLIRSRTWLEEADRSKLSAYKVLHECLTTIAKISAPITPHIAEAIYQNLDGTALTVHMCDWPEADESLIDSKLENQMETIQEIVEVVLKVRQKQGLKLRWPVRKITVKPADASAYEAFDVLRDVFANQTNCKELDILQPGQDFDDYVLQVKPKEAAIGKAYKQWSSKIATLLESRPAEVVAKEIRKGQYVLGIEGHVIRVDPEMVEIGMKLPKNVVSVAHDKGEIFVDMEITPEIRGEGFARETIRRIQEMRKEIDLDVEDFVSTKIKGGEELLRLVAKWKDFIATETRSRDLHLSKVDIDEEYVVEWNIEGEVVTIGITPLYMKEALNTFTQIPGINEKKAVLMYDAGYNSLASLEQATSGELGKIEGMDELDVRRIESFLSLSLEERAFRAFVCPFCDIDLSSGTTVCPRCGESIEEEKHICPECKNEVSAEALICEHCGAQLMEVAAATVIKDKIDTLTHIGGVSVENAEWLLSKGYDYDRLAGADLEEIRQVEGIRESLAFLLADHFGKVEHVCPLCGTKVEADATVCRRCGTSLVPVEGEPEEAPPVEAEAPEELPPEEAVPEEAPLLEVEEPVEDLVEEAAEEPEPKPVPEGLEVEVEEPPIADAEIEIPDLNDAFTYLVKEERSDYTFRMLLKGIEKGKPGFCVTRIYPDKVREAHGLEDVPILWLSNVGKEDSVRPKDLEKLSLSLEQFITKKSGIVLLDGIEYLITNNNFITVLRLIQSLRDQIAINRSILLISVNPATLDEHQLNLLEREVDTVLGPYP
ncbi:MAG: isoleucine--tRNA ligase [Thermoplasmata archaeon]|nr:isoleucine--tRNA ligase [Thermoplasmata archaeon]